ncbi:hypothetical protein NDU88_001558 [Pleurodeles waltl]|uniref:Uncharacterized protein n=1 Tax=Pleurodeles waltl TaxID=8319 RepID=A0AAV7T0P6_PLEWA|nr:hypothetical protein NDU88_001558 [Pleurodeles waltl]
MNGPPQVWDPRQRLPFPPVQSPCVASEVSQAGRSSEDKRDPDPGSEQLHGHPHGAAQRGHRVSLSCQQANIGPPGTHTLRASYQRPRRGTLTFQVRPAPLVLSVQLRASGVVAPLSPPALPCSVQSGRLLRISPATSFLAASFSRCLVGLCFPIHRSAHCMRVLGYQVEVSLLLPQRGADQDDRWWPMGLIQVG